MARTPKGTFAPKRATLVAFAAVTLLGFSFAFYIDELATDAAAMEPDAAYAQLQHIVQLLWLPAIVMIGFALYLWRQTTQRWLAVLVVVLALVPPVGLWLVLQTLDPGVNP